MNSKKFNQCAEKTSTLAPPHEEEGNSTKFLWVNETSNDPAIRSKIRAHARKDGARRFKESHKLASRPHYPELRSKFVSSNSQVLPAREMGDGDKGLAPSNRPFLAEAGGARGDEYQSVTQTNHKAPGRQKNAERANNNLGDKGSLVKRGRVRGPHFGPVELLGAGRVDPFSSYCVDNPKRYVHEFLDHAIHYILPGLVPDDALASAVSPIKKVWFSLALEHPLFLHTLVFSGSVHRDFLRWTNIFPDSPAALTHKILVIQKLNEMLADPKQACRDEVFAAIIVLASHEVMYTPEVARNPFNSPLKNTQWINFYGHVRYVPEHMKALPNLIAQRGGLENIVIPGLAEILVFGDVTSATNTVSKPALKLLTRTKPWISSLKTWAISPPQSPIQTQAAGFKRLKYVSLTNDMLEAFETIGALTLAIDCYLRGELVGLKLGAIARARTPIQHMLLSLPNATELTQSDTNRPMMYECCRIATQIYGIAVVFPLNSFSVLQELVKNLRNSLEASENEHNETADIELLIWIQVLGGVAALDKPERPWFVSRLAALLEEDRLNLRDWPSIEQILKPFLWLDSACGSGGKLLWSEVLEAVASSKGKMAL